MHKCSYIILMLTTIVSLEVGSANGFATLASDLETPKKCVRERTHKISGYNCANLNLKDIPQTLKTGFQIFDLSFNRIRDLDRKSFERYTDVKYLYLFENMIQNIEKDTFADMEDLEAIDLSYNALTSVPLELFRITTLRNMYLAGNNLHDLPRDLDTLEKPIQAPLQILNIADCRLYSIPNFGILPDLWQLNISSNPLTDIKVQQFSPMCNLKILDVNNTQISMCDCQRITTNLVLKHVNIENNGAFCDVRYIEEQYKCMNADDKNAELVKDSPDHMECLALRESRKKNTKAKTAWMAIAAVVFAFILLFCCGLFYLHRRNAKKIKNKQKNINPIKVLVHQNDMNRDKLITDCD